MAKRKTTTQAEAPKIDPEALAPVAGAEVQPGDLAHDLANPGVIDAPADGAERKPARPWHEIFDEIDEALDGLSGRARGYSYDLERAKALAKDARFYVRRHMAGR